MKKIKEHIKTLNRKIINNLSFLTFLLIVFFSACMRNEKKQLLYSNVDKSSYFEIIYLKNKIIIIENSSVNDIKYKDTSNLIMKKGQYYSSIKNLVNSKESLIMSTTKDTTYKYENMGKSFFYSISKNDDSTFKAGSINGDSLRFKLKTTYFYDNKFTIFKIEENVNGKITQWK